VRTRKRMESWIRVRTSAPSWLLSAPSTTYKSGRRASRASLYWVRWTSWEVVREEDRGGLRCWRVDPDRLEGPEDLLGERWVRRLIMHKKN
jgi:hypothetical protein